MFLPSGGDTRGSSLPPCLPHLQGNLHVTQRRVAAHRPGQPSRILSLEENVSHVYKACPLLEAPGWLPHLGALKLAAPSGGIMCRQEGNRLEAGASLGGNSLFL